MATYQLATAWALLKNYKPRHGKASTAKEGGDLMTKTTPTRLSLRPQSPWFAQFAPTPVRTPPVPPCLRAPDCHSITPSKTRRTVDSWRHNIGVKSEFLNRAPIRENPILLATLLKHCKVLVEENLGAPRTLGPPNLENCDLYIAASLLTLIICSWMASGVNTGYANSFVRTQGKTPWPSKVEP